MFHDRADTHTDTPAAVAAPVRHAAVLGDRREQAAATRAGDLVGTPLVLEPVACAGLVGEHVHDLEDVESATVGLAGCVWHGALLPLVSLVSCIEDQVVSRGILYVVGYRAMRDRSTDGLLCL